MSANARTLDECIGPNTVEVRTNHASLDHLPDPGRYHVVLDGDSLFGIPGFSRNPFARRFEELEGTGSGLDLSSQRAKPLVSEAVETSVLDIREQTDQIRRITSDFNTATGVEIDQPVHLTPELRFIYAVGGEEWRLLVRG